MMTLSQVAVELISLSIWKEMTQSDVIKILEKLPMLEENTSIIFVIQVSFWKVLSNFIIVRLNGLG